MEEKCFLKEFNDYYEILEFQKIAPVDQLICECHLVSVQDFEDHILENLDDGFELVLAKLKIGHGCGSCQKLTHDLKYFFKQVRKEN